MQDNILFEKAGFKVVVFQDQDNYCPRGMEAYTSTFVTTNRFKKPDFRLPEEAYSTDHAFRLHLRSRDLTIDDVVAVTVYIDRNGGFSVESYQNEWDGGQQGYLYEIKEDACGEFGVDEIDQALFDKIEDRLFDEIDLLNRYYTEGTYGFSVQGEDGENLISIGGFIGLDFEKNRLMEWARDALEYAIDNKTLPA